MVLLQLDQWPVVQQTHENHETQSRTDRGSQVPRCWTKEWNPIRSSWSVAPEYRQSSWWPGEVHLSRTRGRCWLKPSSPCQHGAQVLHLYCLCVLRPHVIQPLVGGGVGLLCLECRVPDCEMCAGTPGISALCQGDLEPWWPQRAVGCLQWCILYMSVLEGVCLSWRLSYKVSVLHDVCLSWCLSYKVSVLHAVLSALHGVCLAYMLSVSHAVCPTWCLSYKVSVLHGVCLTCCLSYMLSVSHAVCPTCCLSHIAWMFPPVGSLLWLYH